MASDDQITQSLIHNEADCSVTSQNISLLKYNFIFDVSSMQTQVRLYISLKIVCVCVVHSTKYLLMHLSLYNYEELFVGELNQTAQC